MLACAFGTFPQLQGALVRAVFVRFPSGAGGEVLGAVLGGAGEACLYTSVLVGVWVVGGEDRGITASTGTLNIAVSIVVIV